MKLPVDPKRRTQLLALAGVVTVLFLVLLYIGLSFLLTLRSQTQIDLEDAREKLGRLEQEIKAFPAVRQARDDLFWNIQFMATNHILFHEYRNYHLTAREILLPLAAETGISLDIPKEGIVIDLPVPEPKSTNKVARASSAGKGKGAAGPASPVFSLYPVSATGRAGFDQLLAFLRRIESRNPYISVSDLHLTADPATPETHDFSITLLWPIWKNLDQKPKLKDLILPAQEYGESESN